MKFSLCKCKAQLASLRRRCFVNELSLWSVHEGWNRMNHNALLRDLATSLLHKVQLCLLGFSRLVVEIQNFREFHCTVRLILCSEVLTWLVKSHSSFQAPLVVGRVTVLAWPTDCTWIFVLHAKGPAVHTEFSLGGRGVCLGFFVPKFYFSVNNFWRKQQLHLYRLTQLRWRQEVIGLNYLETNHNMLDP